MNTNKYIFIGMGLILLLIISGCEFSNDTTGKGQFCKDFCEGKGLSYHNYYVPDSYRNLFKCYCTHGFYTGDLEDEI